MAGDEPTLLDMPVDPLPLLQPRRTITGISAILLPFRADGAVDWESFCAHVDRTARAGITPAVNMDTGYVNLLDDAMRQEVLAQTSATLGQRPFVAGAFVPSRPGDVWDMDACRRQLDLVHEHGGTPVIFQSFGLTSQPAPQIVETYAAIGSYAPRFIAFELGQMFAPFGMIYDLETYAGLLAIPECIGAKHSSLSRQLEWQRLALRNQRRPDFKVFTGNDLAIDMVMYGSDYLLGLSTFAPDLFAKRDAMWVAGDPAFYELNDLLQYLGFFAFRAPVPAYKHSAAQFLHIRGWIESNRTHTDSAARPASDEAVLQELWERLSAWSDR